MVVSILGSQIIGIIPLADIVFYMTSFNLFMFVAALVFTFIIAISKTETQVEAEFGSLGDREIKVAKKEFKFRRFLAIICGLATAGAMVTGDIFDFTLFVCLIGIVNIGIVGAVKQVDVLDSAFQYEIGRAWCSEKVYI